MLILICFGDNDFSSTLRAFGNLLLTTRPEGVKWVTKARIVELWNELSLGLYLLSQRRYKLEDWGYAYAGDTEHTRNWLKIKEDKVLLDDEAQQFLHDNYNGANFEWLLIDINPYKSTATVI